MGSIRERNAEIFNDTMNFVKNNVDTSLVTQEIILENDNITDVKAVSSISTEIKVSGLGSFDAARQYTNKKVAVLNFASATTPGGGVTKGSSAQEECLCRCSDLYCYLSNSIAWEKFYAPHRLGLSALHNDDIIYTSGVTIVKTDSYKLLDKNNFKKVDVITCAAPNLKENPCNQFNMEVSNNQIKISDEDLLKLHEKRAERILKVAASHGAQVVILGAFGCGVFRNKPEIVAQAYKNILQKFNGIFETVEFAVFCSKDPTNYNTFKSIL